MTDSMFKECVAVRLREIARELRRANELEAFRLMRDYNSDVTEIKRIMGEDEK